MWQNLRDVRSMAEKVAAVVAPPLEEEDGAGGDGGDEGEVAYYDEEEEDGAEYDEEDEFEEEDDDDDGPSQPRSPFGLVGNLLARAMDSEQDQFDQSHSSETIEHSGTEEDQIDFSQQSEVESSHEEQEDGTSGSQLTPLVPTESSQNLPSRPMVQHPVVMSSSFAKRLDADSTSSANEGTSQQHRHLQRDGSASTFSTAPSVGMKEPSRFGLVRESGSVTPQSSPRRAVRDSPHVSTGPPSSNSISTRSIGSVGGKEVSLSPLQRTVSANNNNEYTIDDDKANGTHDTVVTTDKTVSSPLNKPPVGNGEAIPVSSPSNEDAATHTAENTKDYTKEVPTLADESAVTNATTPAPVPPFPPSPKPVEATPSVHAKAEENPGPPVHAHSSERSTALGQNGTTSQSTNESNNKMADTSDQGNKRIERLEKRCKELKRQLGESEKRVGELQQKQPRDQNGATDTVQEQSRDDEMEHLMQQFQEKEARLLQAAAEEHEHDIQMLRQEMEAHSAALQRQLVEERTAFQQNQQQLDAMVTEATARAEAIEQQAEQLAMADEREASQIQQQQARTLRKTEDKLAQTLALLDDREEKVTQLRDAIDMLESKMSEHNEGAQEAEEEIDELHTENEALQKHVGSLKAECSRLRDTVSKLEADSDKMVHLKMELRMLKEDHSRAEAKVQNVAASAESNTAQLESERDEALAAVNDLQHQLSAALADVDVAKADADRIMTGNANLQSALEAFQNERDAELTMIAEQQRQQQEATAAVHAASFEATHEAHQAELRHAQQTANAVLAESQEEIKLKDEKLERLRLENVQTRRSLDEAISRLQTTQDDVIDRTFMKNTLLDWLTKTETKERKRVLELMASVLHFSEEEKERVHLDDGGSLRKLMAPPPSKVDMDHLDGDNVREKWVNFLIGEAED